jgi:hypothetical protein
VLRGEEFGGELFITIAHRKDFPSVNHYYRSPLGKELAHSVAQVLQQRRHLKNISSQEGADYTITQPHSPSIVVNFGEAYLCGEKWPDEKLLSKEAQGVYEGMVKFQKKLREAKNPL